MKLPMPGEEREMETFVKITDIAASEIEAL
jgi:hypothetical protein